MASLLIFVCASAVGALLVGVLGTGSSLVLLPTFGLLFEATLAGTDTLRLAAGTTMATIAVGAVAGAISQFRAGQVDTKLLKLTIAPYVAGGLIGPWVNRMLPAGALGIYVASLICIVAVRMLLARPALHGPVRRIDMHRLEAVVVLLIIGIGCSIAGIASGVFAIPYLSRFDVPLRTVIGTSTASAACYASGGALGYITAGWTVPGLPTGHLGFVYLPAFAVTAITAIVVTPLGVRLASHLNERVLKRIFAGFLFCAAAAVLFAR